MKQTYNYTSSDYVVGNINSSGQWTSQSNRLRPNDFITLNGAESITISFSGANGANLQGCISCVNANGSLIQEYYWLSSPYTCTPPSNAVKIAVIFRKSDNSDLTPADLASLTVELSLPGQWYFDEDGNLTNTDFITLPSMPFVGDSPLTEWRIDPDINNGMPYVPLMLCLPVLAHTGAFMDCANLSYVEIPHSCKSIGRYAFAGTALKKVKIAADCTYYDTSFPEDCEIEFYGGGGQWTQLIDGDGKAVVDGNGLRVYVEEEV